MALGGPGYHGPDRPDTDLTGLDHTEVETQRSSHHDEPQSYLSSWGAYAHLRRAQFVGLALMTLGLVLRWPSSLALAMFPGLVFNYARPCAHRGAQRAGEVPARLRALSTASAGLCASA